MDSAGRETGSSNVSRQARGGKRIKLLVVSSTWLSQVVETIKQLVIERVDSVDQETGSSKVTQADSIGIDIKHKWPSSGGIDQTNGMYRDDDDDLVE